MTKKENSTFIIVLMLLNRTAFTLNFQFNKYETKTYLQTYKAILFKCTILFPWQQNPRVFEKLWNFGGFCC